MHNQLVRLVVNEATSAQDFVTRLRAFHNSGEFRLDTHPPYPNWSSRTSRCGG